MQATISQTRVTEALADVYRGWVGYGFENSHVDRMARRNSFAFIIGVLLDGGGVTADQAWRGMINLGRRLARVGVPFTPKAVAAMPLRRLKRLAAEEPCIHRFHALMASYIKGAARHIAKAHRGDADALLEAISAREVFHRLIAIKGIGDKKANMAVRLLVDELGYEYEDIDLMNVPVDVHVIRVCERSGLVERGANRVIIQRAAVAFYPEAPWTLDAAWTIGKNWCTATRPHCDGNPDASECDEAATACPLRKVCPRHT
jgi:endonuclease III